MRDFDLLTSFRCAFEGLWEALRTQRNLRIHFFIAFVTILAGIVLQLTAIEWALITLTIGGMFVAELFNTVVEATIDLITDRYHPLAKRAKDISAGAVLVAAIVSVIVGLLIFGPRLLNRIG